MPLPGGADERHQPIGHFGPLRAYIFDPYSIDVMKIDRAFPADIEDVRFLIQGGHIDLATLERCVADVAGRYEEAADLWRHFAEMRRGL